VGDPDTEIVLRHLQCGRLYYWADLRIESDMTIYDTEWLITSDQVLEAAFRIDLPEPHQGMWMLSYLPTHLRLTRDQAMIGMTLAETVLAGQLDDCDYLAREVAQLRANELGFTFYEVACLLAARSPSPAVVRRHCWSAASPATRTRGSIS